MLESSSQGGRGEEMRNPNDGAFDLEVVRRQLERETPVVDSMLLYEVTRHETHKPSLKAMEKEIQEG